MLRCAATNFPSLHEVSHLLLQLETPLEAVTAFALAARTAGVQVVLNAAPARALPTELLRSVDVLIVNEGELATLTGHQGTVSECLAQLDVPCVVVTLGARGCCARRGTEFFLQPGFKVQAVDTTAAGDTFCGALVAAMSQASSPWPDALALCQRRVGAGLHPPGRTIQHPARTEEVLALLRAGDRHARRRRTHRSPPIAALADTRFHSIPKSRRP